MKNVLGLINVEPRPRTIHRIVLGKPPHPTVTFERWGAEGCDHLVCISIAHGERHLESFSLDKDDLVEIAQLIKEGL